MRVAYTGKNRNKSFISKQTFEKCIWSIYNCPVVCNYNRDTDSIGSHDVEIVNDEKGLRIINVTQPVGVVPESSNYSWDIVEKENGDVHEYLCVDVIIWKRQEAYRKIKENGITDESMEIKVKSGHTVDGIYHIDSFEFTAFCLLESAEPCYESACVEVFSLSDFKTQYSKMMSELKENPIAVTTSNEADINSQNTNLNLSKGGKISLTKVQLLAKYGLKLEALDFDINDFSIEELEKKFAEIKKKIDEEDEIEGETITEPTEDSAESENPEENPDSDNEGNDDNQDSQGQNPSEPTGEPESGDSQNTETQTENNVSYSLTGEQFLSELLDALFTERYIDPFWGDVPRYMYVDYDTSLSEVYCYDSEDWKLYGFKFSMNGDNVVIDFESKRRKKFVIADFDEGDIDFSYKNTFETFGKAILASKNSELNASKAEFGVATKTIEELKAELDTLKEYQKEKMAEERENEESELFARFSELNGIEAFEELRSNCADMTLEQIENKCFELKGRNVSLSFSVTKPKSTRIAIEGRTVDNEPYGGLFKKYSSQNN